MGRKRDSDDEGSYDAKVPKDHWESTDRTPSEFHKARRRLSVKLAPGATAGVFPAVDERLMESQDSVSHSGPPSEDDYEEPSGELADFSQPLRDAHGIAQSTVQMSKPLITKPVVGGRQSHARQRKGKTGPEKKKKKKKKKKYSALI
eukprot:Platyproteum_vivax@DN11652_c0_g1_i1.p1